VSGANVYHYAVYCRTVYHPLAHRYEQVKEPMRPGIRNKDVLFVLFLYSNSWSIYSNIIRYSFPSGNLLWTANTRPRTLDYLNMVCHSVPSTDCVVPNNNVIIINTTWSEHCTAYRHRHRKGVGNYKQEMCCPQTTNSTTALHRSIACPQDCHNQPTSVTQRLSV